MNHEVKLTWSTKEYDHSPKSVDWYWAIGIVTVVVIVISVLYKNYLFAVFIFLGMIILSYFNSRRPRTIMVQITNRGIQIADELFLYTRIKGFWVEPEKKRKDRFHLLIQTNRFFSPLLSVPIPEKVSRNHLREILLVHIPEKELHENPAYEIMEGLGF